MRKAAGSIPVNTGHEWLEFGTGSCDFGQIGIGKSLVRIQRRYLEKYRIRCGKLKNENEAHLHTEVEPARNAAIQRVARLSHALKSLLTLVGERMRLLIIAGNLPKRHCQAAVLKRRQSVMVIKFRWLLVWVTSLLVSGCAGNRVSVKDLEGTPFIRYYDERVELHIPYLRSISNKWVKIEILEHSNSMLCKGYFSSETQPWVWKIDEEKSKDVLGEIA